MICYWWHCSWSVTSCNAYGLLLLNLVGHRASSDCLVSSIATSCLEGEEYCAAKYYPRRDEQWDNKGRSLLPCPNKVKQGTGNIFAATLMPGMFVVALPLLYCPMAWGTLALDIRVCFCIWRPRVGMVWHCMLWWHCARCIIRTGEVRWSKYIGRSRRFCKQKKVVACRCSFFSSVSKIHVGQL